MDKINTFWTKFYEIAATSDVDAPVNYLLMYGYWLV
jgi:hypothetical protein